MKRNAYFWPLRPVFSRCISGSFATFAVVRKEVRSEMLLRRASLLIWKGFGAPQGGFGGPPVPTFGVLFWLPRQVGRFAPPATPFGPSSELIFDTFSEVP